MKPLVKPERVFNREREWDGLNTRSWIRAG